MQNLLNYQLENVNSELSLLTLDVNDYEGKLLVITNKAENEKDLNRHQLLVRHLLAVNFKEIKSKELLVKLIRRISLFSPVGFISGLTPKENVEIHKQNFLLSFSKLSAKELTEIYLENNKAYFFDCCHSCQKDFQKIRLEKDQEALNRFFFCSDSSCINFGFQNNLSHENHQ